MIIIPRVILGLFAFGMLIAGVAFAFMPARAAADFAITASSLAGLGTLRADLGGSFLALGVFTLLGIRPGHARWLVVPLVFIAAFLALRLFHLAADGVSAGGVRSTIVEIVLLGALLWARAAFRAERQT